MNILKEAGAQERWFPCPKCEGLGSLVDCVVCSGKGMLSATKLAPANDSKKNNKEKNGELTGLPNSEGPVEGLRKR